MSEGNGTCACVVEHTISQKSTQKHSLNICSSEARHRRISCNYQQPFLCQYMIAIIKRMDYLYHHLTW